MAKPLTEELWLAATDPRPMLEFLRASGKASYRKLRLVAGACCRRLWPSLKEEALRVAVEVGERFADGRATAEGLADASLAAFLISFRLMLWQGEESSQQTAAEAVAHASCNPDTDDNPFADRVIDVASNVADAAGYATAEAAGPEGRADRPTQACSAALRPAREAELLALANLLRDLFGNPFRPLPPLPHPLLTWRIGLIPKLAEAVYENRILPSGHLDPSRLGVLADASEEAGCTEKDILAHLREPGAVHVRGCHLVDALLGKG